MSITEKHNRFKKKHNLSRPSSHTHACTHAHTRTNAHTHVRTHTVPHQHHICQLSATCTRAAPSRSASGARRLPSLGFQLVLEYDRPRRITLKLVRLFVPRLLRARPWRRRAGDTRWNCLTSLCVSRGMHAY